MNEKQKPSSSNFSDLGKIPPQAVELEESLLGSIISFGAFEHCYKTINSKMFYKETHKIIFKNLEEMWNSKTPISVETLNHNIRKNNEFETIGGPIAILTLIDKAEPSRYKIEFNARIIYQLFVSRELIRLASNLINEAYDIKADVADILDKLISEINKLYRTNYLDIPTVIRYERVLLNTCVNEPGIFGEILGSTPDNIFIDKCHQVVWNIMKGLIETGFEINELAIYDILDNSSNKAYVPYVREIFETEKTSAESISYILSYLKRYYDHSQLVKVSRYLEDNLGKAEVEAIIAFIENILDDIRVKDIEMMNFTSQLDRVMSTIISNAQTGGDATIIKTGYEKVDDEAQFRPGDIVLMGASRGHGKSKMSWNIARNMFKHNHNFAALIISMEDSHDVIITNLIAMETGIEIGHIRSVNHNLTEEERTKIKNAEKALRGLDLLIIDRDLSIRQIESVAVKFVKKRPNKRCLVVIDNIMKITDMKSDVKVEDDIAKRISSIAKRNGALVFMLHHFTKEQEALSNASEGYRPKESHLKGSTRFLDVSTHVWLMLLPKKYKDLVREQSKRAPIKVFDDDPKLYERRRVLSKLLVTEFTKLRGGTNEENKTIVRFLVDYNKLKIAFWR